MDYALDDAAVAALWALRHADTEHLGLLYEQDGRILATPTRSQGDEGRSRGRFSIPAGSLRALFHNHPLSGSPRRDRHRREFSDTDVDQAVQLGVPSYILAGDEVRRYVPRANSRVVPGITEPGEPVLAQFPIEEFRAYLLRRGLLR